MAKIANVALTNTFNTWRTYSNIAFDRLSQFAINNSSLYANTITANVAFTSTGLATLSGRATVGTNLTVSGNTTLGAAGKTITTTGAAAHTGTKTISTNLTVSGNTTLGAAGKTITTTGAAAHTGTQSVSTNLTVSGNTTLGAATVTTLTASADSSFTSTGSLIISKGTTGQRPTPASGMLRFNTTTLEFEGYNGTAWASVGGAALSNDTSTTANLYPLFASATTGTAATLFTGNAYLLYKPSTGELRSRVPVASNGIVVNSLTVATSYTIAAGHSGMSSGPITVSGGAAVTLSAGSRWVVL